MRTALIALIAPVLLAGQSIESCGPGSHQIRGTAYGRENNSITPVQNLSIRVYRGYRAPIATAVDSAGQYRICFPSGDPLDEVVFIGTEWGPNGLRNLAGTTSHDMSVVIYPKGHANGLRASADPLRTLRTVLDREPEFLARAEFSSVIAAAIDSAPNTLKEEFIKERERLALEVEGKARLLENNLASAISTLERAAAQAPDRVPVHLALTEAYRQQAKTHPIISSAYIDKARVSLGVARDLDPGDDWYQQLSDAIEVEAEVARTAPDERLFITLEAGVSTKQIQATQELRGFVTAPPLLAGAVLHGLFTVRRGTTRKTAPTVFLHFNALTFRDVRVPISAVVVEVRNSRGVAGVDDEGRVLQSKRRVPAVAAALLGALAGGLAAGAKGAAIGAAAGAAAGSLGTTLGPDNVELAAGTQLELSVKKRP